MHNQRYHSQTDQLLSFIHQGDTSINSSEFPLKSEQSQSMRLSYCASFVFHWMHCIRNYCFACDIAISFVVLSHWSLIILRIYSSIGFDLTIGHLSFDDARPKYTSRLTLADMRIREIQCKSLSISLQKCSAMCIWIETKCVVLTLTNNIWPISDLIRSIQISRNSVRPFVYECAPVLFQYKLQCAVDIIYFDCVFNWRMD